MSRIALFAAAAALALGTPAMAQHQGHHMPPPKAKPAPKKPAAKKPAAKKPAAKKPAGKKPAARKPASKKTAPKKPAPRPVADPHAGHVMPEAKAQQPAADPHAGHVMPEAMAQEPVADPHAGHERPEAPQQVADPHAGHDMGAPTEVPLAPPPPAALAGPAHAADTAFDPVEMARARAAMAGEHGASLVGKFLVERAEARVRNGRDGYRLDVQAWHGGDLDKLWLKAEADGDWGRRPGHIEGQALWSHAIAPFFDVQAGVRYDVLPGPDRAHAVLGIQGLAPYWFEVDTAVFLSNKGELTARAEVEYDLRVTQRLILQPQAELDLSLQNIPELGTGAGLSEASLGARLRYEITPQFAPYIGVEAVGTLGRTRDYRRREGDKASHVDFLAGVRLFF
jgi:copper resistance protein B